MLSRIKAYLDRHPRLIGHLEFICAFVGVLLALLLLASIIDLAKTPPSTTKEIQPCKL